MSNINKAAYSDLASDGGMDPRHQAEQSRPVAGDARVPPAAFIAWLQSQIPPGTVIGDPVWWAPRLWSAMQAETTAQANASQVADVENALRFMTKLWSEIDAWAYQHVCGDALAHYPVVQGTTQQMALKRLARMPIDERAAIRLIQRLGARRPGGDEHHV